MLIMAFTKNDIGTVAINAHLVGPDKIYIEWFHVPRELRRRGLGTAAYKRWEKSLPKAVKYITLHAADAGTGPSNDFWISLGFRYRWAFGYTPDPSDKLYEASQAMIKGIHGTPTPETTHIEPDDVNL